MKDWLKEWYEFLNSEVDKNGRETKIFTLGLVVGTASLILTVLILFLMDKIFYFINT